MIWKSIIIAFLAVGVLAEYKISDEQRQQFKDMLRQSCKKQGAEDKVDAVEAQIKSFFDCVRGLFDADTIKKEIEDAKPNGALDEVFKKYCAKSPQLKSCLHSVTTAVAPCVDSNIRDHIGTVDNATDQFIDFVCYKDGDRIALFIAEGGPECFKEKASSINECASKTKESIGGLDDAKKLSIDEQCAKFDELSACIVKALEECSTPTPGNMVESLLRFVRKTAPCKNK